MLKTKLMLPLQKNIDYIGNNLFITIQLFANIVMLPRKKKINFT